MSTESRSDDRGTAAAAQPVVDETPAADGEPSHAKRKRKHLPIWQETILLLGLALVLAVVIKAAFLQAFYIPSESMEPGLVANDRILVQKVSYWFGGTPERGDVVVFEDPDNWLGENVESGPPNGFTEALATVGLYPTGGHLVKRVIGVEGDVIVCCDDRGRISVNGKALDESAYVPDVKGVPCNGPMTGKCDWTAGPVPEGHVFVMGDNRGSSADSTVHMCAPEATDCTDNPYVADDLVVGKVFVLLWPRDHFDWIGRPKVFDKIPAPE